MNPKCPVCGLQTKHYEMVNNNPDMYFVDCYRCGSYNISSYVMDDRVSGKISADKRGNLSAWIYHHQVATILRNDYYRIIQLHSFSVDEKVKKLLLFLSDEFPLPGQKIPDLLSDFRALIDNVENEKFSKLRSIEFLDILPYSWISDINELQFILKDYLCESGLISYDGHIKILPAGWRYIDEIKNSNVESNIIFIAMRFTEELLKFCDDFIEPAIQNAGYDPLRIDKHIHDRIIDDEIISSIRKSKLIVSDFTDNSSGVYFETGFARGLNIPVIYLCQKNRFEDERQKPHFDVNHYPFLLWQKEDGGKLKKDLQLRIEALVGSGLNQV